MQSFSKFRKKPKITVEMGKKTKESDFFDLFFSQEIKKKLLRKQICISIKIRKALRSTHTSYQFYGSKSLLAFDNFFTSVDLVTSLLRKEIFSVGTVRINQKGLPDMIKNKNKLQRGQSQIKNKGCVAAVKWMDAKIVTLLSTAHDSETITTVKRTLKNGSKIDVPCPSAVATYNRIMGGVDRFDKKTSI